MVDLSLFINIDEDYKNLALLCPKASLEKEKHGCQNKQTILLIIKCFKLLCLKAQTKKASEIHKYYMKLGKILHEIVEEETNELKLQLQEKFIIKILNNNYKSIFLCILKRNRNRVF